MSRSADYSKFVADLEADTPRPIVTGGTGYPRKRQGSLELRVDALVRLVDDPAPEDYLVLGTFQRIQVRPAPAKAQTPQQIVQQLCEAADAICREIPRAMDLLSMLGHQIQSTRQIERLCRLGRELSRR